MVLLIENNLILINMILVSKAQSLHYYSKHLKLFIINYQQLILFFSFSRNIIKQN